MTFTVPEADFQRLVDVSQGFRKPMAVKAFSQETGVLLDTGEVSITDNRVDPATGTIELKAKFSNAAHRLWPGQFVNVELTLQTLQHVVTIPVTAENRGPNGTFAFVVGPGGKAELRVLETSRAIGTNWLVTGGLKPGDRLIVDGLINVQPGAAVKAVPAGPTPPPIAVR